MGALIATYSLFGFIMMWLIAMIPFGIIGLLIGKSKGLNLWASYFGGAALGIFVFLMFLLTRVVNDYTCPHCGLNFRASKDLKVIVCPNCRREFSTIATGLPYNNRIEEPKQ